MITGGRKTCRQTVGHHDNGPMQEDQWFSLLCAFFTLWIVQHDVDPELFFLLCVRCACVWCACLGCRLALLAREPVCLRIFTQHAARYLLRWSQFDMIESLRRLFCTLLDFFASQAEQPTCNGVVTCSNGVSEHLFS